MEKINFDDKLYNILNGNEKLLQFFINNGFDQLKNEKMLKTMGKMVSLNMALKVRGINKAAFEEKLDLFLNDEIIPSDLATYGGEAKNLLQDLQSRNERMFLVTFLVVNMAGSKRKLDNDIFAAAGIAQKYNCALTRLGFQQEEGMMSSIPLGKNEIEIQRGLTTSSTAVFIPFITQELFQSGEALYYELNALSNNMILCDRKQLKKASAASTAATPPPSHSAAPSAWTTSAARPKA